jgi:hypothetical protein
MPARRAVSKATALSLRRKIEEIPALVWLFGEPVSRVGGTIYEWGGASSLVLFFSW